MVDEKVEAVTFPFPLLGGDGIRPNGSNGNSQGKVTPPLDPALDLHSSQPQNLIKETPHLENFTKDENKTKFIMADDTLEAGLLGIALSDSESSDAETCKPHTTTTTTTTANSSSRADRTALSEEAFQSLKATYVPKLENGEVCSHSTAHPLLWLLPLHTNPLQIWATISLPVSASVSKPEAQDLTHAVEELYFLRRWDEAVAFIQRVMAPGTGEGETRLDAGTKQLLRHYERRCRERLSGKSAAQRGQVGLALGVETTE